MVRIHLPRRRCRVDPQRLEQVGACMKLSLGVTALVNVSEETDPEVIWDRIERLYTTGTTTYYTRN